MGGGSCVGPRLCQDQTSREGELGRASAAAAFAASPVGRRERGKEPGCPLLLIFHPHLYPASNSSVLSRLISLLHGVARLGVPEQPGMLLCHRGRLLPAGCCPHRGFPVWMETTRAKQSGWVRDEHVHGGDQFPGWLGLGQPEGARMNGSGADPLSAAAGLSLQRGDRAGLQADGRMASPFAGQQIGDAVTAVSQGSS